MNKKIAASFVVVCVLILSVVVWNFANPENNEQVYVGITYCGDSVEDGKLLIDKVKDYTNLFILGSGTLQRDLESVNELGDYSISAGMDFLPYFGHYVEDTFSAWMESAKQKWGNHLLGVYYGDEPAGKMLDGYVEFKNLTTDNSIMKTMYGDVVLEQTDGVVIHYEIGGDIHLFLPVLPLDSNNTQTQTDVYATFYPDGSIKIDETNATSKTIQLSVLTNFTNYSKLLEMHPIKDNNQAAELFISRNQDNIEYLSDSTTVFTSDYALYWFDYLSGYDVVLTQIGWNHTLNQQIALSRGASNLQNKEWGMIITWKYQQPPYLANGTEILSQMRTGYETGSKYFVVFNYYEDNSGPYGTMKEEHFVALEQFWNDVVQNPKVVHGAIEADSVLVLPQNYGWGIRRIQDRIWGIYEPDNKTQQIWNIMQTLLQNHDLKIDIIYENSDYPLPQAYKNIYYWNRQT